MRLGINTNMTQYEINRAYKKRNKINNLFINVPEAVKRDFKTICSAMGTDMSSVVRPFIDSFIKKHSKHLGS